MIKMLYCCCLTIFISACAIEPAPVRVGPAYVGPAYVRPGVGYAWRYHPNYGWGWHHPGYGWHRGWR